MNNTARVLGGVILSPTVGAIILSLPAIAVPGVFPLIFIWNVAIILPTFLLCGAIAHVVLRWRQSTTLREYCRVMFLVSTVVLTIGQLALLQWTFGGGGAEFHFGTHVVLDGHLTFAGVLLTIVESMVGAALLSLMFALFWAFAVRPSLQTQHGA